MKRVTFSPRAKLDLLSIGEYIATDNPRRAITFVEEIEQRCNALGKRPQSARRFPVLGSNSHIVPFRNYLILYRNLPSEVRIVRVIHGARNIPALLKSESRSED